MKMLQGALMLAVVFSAATAAAQEADKPEGNRLPWWKLSDEGVDEAQPAARDDHRSRPRKADRAGREGPAADRGRRLLPVPDRVVEAAPRRGRASDKPAESEPRERLVYRLAHQPAVDVAQTVNNLLAGEGRGSAKPASMLPIVLAEPITNSLVISGTPGAIHDTVKLIKELDVEPAMVHVQAVIGLVESREGLSLLAPDPEGPRRTCSHEEACELIEEFSRSDAVEILARPEIMTLDNQPAFLQIGDRVPRVTGVKQGQAAEVELENVGIILGLTPRVSPDETVTMEIDLEKSELRPAHEGVPLGLDDEGNVVRSPRINVMMVQTTVKVPPRRAVIVGGMALQEGDGGGELVMVVTAHIQKSQDE